MNPALVEKASYHYFVGLHDITRQSAGLEGPLEEEVF